MTKGIQDSSYEFSTNTFLLYFIWIL